MKRINTIMVDMNRDFWQYISMEYFKQKTAYEMRISDWSSDVCSSDLDEKPGAENNVMKMIADHKFDLIVNIPKKDVYKRQ